MKTIFNTLFLLVALTASAQQSPAMADGMRSEGKIYVVIAVIALIFAALAVFLVYLERKVSRMEKRLKERKNP
jgi:hypothetical protein